MTLSVMPCPGPPEPGYHVLVTRTFLAVVVVRYANNNNGAIIMSKNLRDNENNNRFKGKKVLRFLATIGLAAAMTGCGKLGYLLSNERVVTQTTTTSSSSATLFLPSPAR